MRSLRYKLLLTYLFLVGVLVAVSGWGIYHFALLGRAVDRILVNNYKSILAVENMKEALERQDSAARFHLAGHQARALEQDLVALLNQLNQAGSHSLVVPSEYLEMVILRR